MTVHVAVYIMTCKKRDILEYALGRRGGVSLKRVLSVRFNQCR